MKTIIHLFIWSIYIVIPLYVFPTSSGIVLSNLLFVKIYLIKCLVSIGYFYFCYKYTLPYYFKKSKFLHFIVFTGLFILIASVCTTAVISILTEGNYLDEFGIKYTSASYKARFVVLTIVSLSLFYYERYQSLRLEKINSELNALKAQINPHFLFNTLNGIYGLSLTNSTKTSDSILKLSSIMRYVLTETNTDLVYLKHELEYIDNYIDLQKIRLTNKTTINYTITGNLEDQKVPPLLFINFIENAFKYGLSNEVSTNIEIQIQIQKKQLTLIVKNDKISDRFNQQISSNIGMPNIKKRLQLLYGSDYNLKINDSESIYELALKINLHD